MRKSVDYLTAGVGSVFLNGRVDYGAPIAGNSLSMGKLPFMVPGHKAGRQVEFPVAKIKRAFLWQWQSSVFFLLDRVALFL